MSKSPVSNKNKVISILRKRVTDSFSDGFHDLEKNLMISAIATINQFVPDSYFEEEGSNIEEMSFAASSDPKEIRSILISLKYKINEIIDHLNNE